MLYSILYPAYIGNMPRIYNILCWCTRRYITGWVKRDVLRRILTLYMRIYILFICVYIYFVHMDADPSRIVSHPHAAPP